MSTNIINDHQHEATCDNQCGTMLGENEHIHIFTKGEKEENWCDTCFHDLRDQMKEEGWTHDEEDEDEDEEEEEEVMCGVCHKTCKTDDTDYLVLNTEINGVKHCDECLRTFILRVNERAMHTQR